MKVLTLLLAFLILAIVGCGKKDDASIVVQSDVPAPGVAPSSTPNQSGVGTAVRKVGQIKKN